MKTAISYVAVSAFAVTGLYFVYGGLFQVVDGAVKAVLSLLTGG